MICSSKSPIYSDSILRAPKQRYKIPKRIPTLLDLNKDTKKEKFISFDIVSKLNKLSKETIRPSNESTSTADEEHETPIINREEVFTPMNGVVSILDIISHKVSFDNDKIL